MQTQDRFISFNHLTIIKGLQTSAYPLCKRKSYEREIKGAKTSIQIVFPKIIHEYCV